MSGHSKWSTIKRKKESLDAKRGQQFTKVSRLITVAARAGGADVSANPSLRLALDKARDVNMSKEVIERAIKKGVGGGEGTHFEEIVLEGYGPHGIAILVECLTDNRNRTVGEVRTLLNRAGGSLGETGSAAYIFTGEDPLFTIPLDPDKAASVLRLLDALDDLDDVQEVYSNLDTASIVDGA